MNAGFFLGLRFIIFAILGYSLDFVLHAEISALGQ